MKVRTGHISNSSTTSFCIYGIVLEGDEAEELDGKIWKMEPGSRLDSHGIDQWLPGTVFGLELTKMKGDETRNEFNERVRQLLSEALEREVEPTELGLEQGGWYDG
jgi:hypothetical protein